jgi:DNA helicase-2/ATP-dependent DNA helicase PcrA
MNNKLYIAAAGSGKTTFLVKSAIEKASTETVIILTYTEANESEIRNKIFKLIGSIPENITIQTWFSFLLQHGVKPYQGSFNDILKNQSIRGMLLVNQKSGIKSRSGRYPVYYGEDDFKKYYFTKNWKIYSDKISKFVFQSNKLNGGKIIERLSKIFDNIFIDEVQDLAGFDLELIKLFLSSKSSVLLMGDPRQVTYLTHNPQKHPKYSDGKIKDFLEKHCKKQIKDGIDEQTLNSSHRNNELICKYSFLLYPNLPEPKPCTCLTCHDTNVEHQGLFIIKPEETKAYIDKFKSVELRWNKSVKTLDENNTFNFGESKGLGFDRVLIYPTSKMSDWIKNNNIELTNVVRAKLYVGITRARYSVCFVMQYSDQDTFADIEIYKP